MKRKHLKHVAGIVCLVLAGVWVFQVKNADVRFLGRVIDENGSPLGGALVNYRVKIVTSRNMPFQPSEYDRDQVISRMDGSFEIKGKKGTVLAVGPLSKEGYRDVLRDPLVFGYAGTPELHDKETRVDFGMVKNEIPHAKEVYNKTLRFAWNKEDLRIPLDGGLGDFVLIPTREMNPGQRKGFDWSTKVFMKNAAIVSIGPRTRIAPDFGYKKELEYGYGKDDPQWGSMAKDRCAFRTKDGHYGVLSFYI